MVTGSSPVGAAIGVVPNGHSLMNVIQPIIKKMKKKNVCDFGDILFCAESLGYGWNQAHDILDNYAPRYGARDVYFYEIEEEENPDAKRILKAFFEQENVSEFQINPKSS